MNKINIMLLQNIKDLVITMNFFYEQKQFEKGDDTQRVLMNMIDILISDAKKG